MSAAEKDEDFSLARASYRIVRPWKRLKSIFLWPRFKETNTKR
jgi:hypothetical protein